MAFNCSFKHILYTCVTYGCDTADYDRLSDIWVVMFIVRKIVTEALCLSPGLSAMQKIGTLM